jgi:hypothetical protein
VIPFWLKAVYTLYVAIILPVYFKKYGPGNFLWFSDIALIVTVAALWLESSLVASMMLVAILLPELVWNIGFFAGLLMGKPIFGLADYMFETDKPLYLRALSLFHVFLPLLLLWLVFRLGYDSNALIAQTCVAWIVLPLTYWLTDPAENINWVHGLFGQKQTRLPPLLYLALLMLAFPLLIYFPTHLFLQAVFG